MSIALSEEQKLIKELMDERWILETVPDHLNYDQIKELYQWCYKTFGNRRGDQFNYNTWMYDGNWAGGTLSKDKKPMFYIGFKNETD